MGAVYAAFQADRQVAIKVFLPASPLEQAENEDFQRRLEEIIEQGARLSHPHILPTLDHGKQAGLVYQAMPYMAGENLEALLKRSGALPFEQIQLYLAQLAAALDYAHAQGFLHRDIKASNILLTPEGNVLLADFGLAGLTTEKNFARARRALPGMLNTIAPEYVLGKAIDPRADLYSLGAVLYQMVTGAPPFQAGSLGEVAIKHVKATLPSPSTLRTDLPQAAEQVIMRALAKRPADRYSHARDLASAFRLALEAASPVGYQQKANALDMLAGLASSGSTATRLPVSRSGGLFDPKWQSHASLPAVGEPTSVSASPVPPLSSLSTFPEAAPKDQPNNDLASQAQIDFRVTIDQPGQQTFPQFQPDASPTVFSIPPTPAGSGTRRGGLLSFAPDVNATSALSQPLTQEPVTGDMLELADQETGAIEEVHAASTQQAPASTNEHQTFASTSNGNSENPGSIKLTDPVKVVQVPVAGQPGHFMTGFMPVIPADGAGERTAPKRVSKKRQAITSLLLIVVLIAAGSGILWLVRGHNATPTTTTARTPVAVPTSASARATATADASILFSDNLSQNTQNWPVGPQPAGPQSWYTCAFENGTYHITNNDKKKSAAALLSRKFSAPFAYNLTMEQIKGDETNPNNQFGMILDASVQTVQGKQIDKFYAFEILNKAGGQYQFWKYDNSQKGNAWTKLWSKGLGKEFLQGSGSSHINTIKIMAGGTMFTFLVNGKQVGTVKDSAFSSGSVGMLVNLDGAEVAFSRLLLTRV